LDLDFLLDRTLQMLPLTKNKSLCLTLKAVVPNHMLSFLRMTPLLKNTIANKRHSVYQIRMEHINRLFKLAH